jgi:hypothetical protein
VKNLSDHPIIGQGHSDSVQQTADIYIEEAAVFQMSAVNCLLYAVAMSLADGRTVGC